MRRLTAALLVILMTTTCFVNGIAERPLLFEIPESSEAQNEEAKDRVTLTDFLTRYAWLCQKFNIEYRINPSGVASLYLGEENTYSFGSADINIYKIDPENFDIGSIRYNLYKKYPDDPEHSMAIVYSVVNSLWLVDAAGKRAVESRFEKYYLKDFEKLKIASKDDGVDLGNGYRALYVNGVLFVAANKFIEE